MHFAVVVALVVASFVASCSSFVSAGTYALDVHVNDGTEVRRLREDNDVQEERGGGVGVGGEFENGFFKVEAAVIHPIQHLSDEEIAALRAAKKEFHETNSISDSPTNPNMNRLNEEEVAAAGKNMVSDFTPGELKLLKARGINVDKLKAGDKVEASKVFRLALRSPKAEESLFVKVIKWMLIAVGSSTIAYFTLWFILSSIS